MKTFPRIAALLAAPLIFFGALIVGFNFFYAEPPALWGGVGLLAGGALVAAVKRWGRGAGFYAAWALGLLVIYPKLSGLESYGREAGISGMLGLLRIEIADAHAKTGRFPAGGEGLRARAFELRQGHATSTKTETVRLPPEAFPSPPAGLAEPLTVKVTPAGSAVEVTGFWDAGARAPVFLFPGGEYSYAVLRQNGQALRFSGTVSVPLPAGFTPDSGNLVYDPDRGFLFINCTHLSAQKGRPWWTY